MAACGQEPCGAFQASSDLLAKAGEVSKIMNTTFAAGEQGEHRATVELK